VHLAECVRWRRDLCGGHLRQQPPSQGTGFSTPHKYPLGSGWLGSVSLDAANIYAEIDLEVKANALAKSALVPESKSGKRWRDQPALMAFLRRSQSISYVAFEAPFAATEATGGPERHINPGAT
jgi:hypothetical protein